MEPEFLLGFGELHACEVGDELVQSQPWLLRRVFVGMVTNQLPHHTPAREVALQEHDQVPLRHHQPAAKNHNSSRRAHGIIKGIKARRGQNKPPHYGQKRQKIHTQRQHPLPPKPPQKQHHRIIRRHPLLALIIHLQIRIIHRA